MKTHLVYWFGAIVLTALLWCGFTAWRAEHDSRLIAETKIAAAEQTVSHLQADIATITADRDAHLAALEKQRKTVTTPTQAITAIPDLSNVPLAPRPVPDEINRVSVDALGLFTELNACKQTEIKLDACTQTAAKTADILKEKDVEIVALKKKPSFFKRVVATLKSVGVGIGIGVALSHGL